MRLLKSTPALPSSPKLQRSRAFMSLSYGATSSSASPIARAIRLTLGFPTHQRLPVQQGGSNGDQVLPAPVTVNLRPRLRSIIRVSEVLVGKLSAMHFRSAPDCTAAEVRVFAIHALTDRHAEVSFATGGWYAATQSLYETMHHGLGVTAELFADAVKLTGSTSPACFQFTSASMPSIPSATGLAGVGAPAWITRSMLLWQILLLKTD